MHRMGPVTLAQKAFGNMSDLAYYLFSILSKNLEVFFQPLGLKKVYGQQTEQNELLEEQQHLLNLILRRSKDD